VVATILRSVRADPGISVLPKGVPGLIACADSMRASKRVAEVKLAIAVRIPDNEQA